MLVSNIFFFATLLFAELSLSKFAAYTAPVYFLSFTASLIFLATSLGSLLNLHPKAKALSDDSLYLSAIAALLISFVGIGTWPNFEPLWLLPPFFFLGFILSRLFMSVRVLEMIRAGTLGALLIIFVILVLPPASARYYPELLFAMLACSSLARSRQFNSRVVVCALMLLTASARRGGLFEPKPSIQRDVASLRNATKLRPTIYTPWLNTDVFLTAHGSVIVTNGVRYSVVAEPDQTLAAKSKLLAFPLAMGPFQNALLIGPAGGQNVARVLRAGVGDVDAVDVNPDVFSVMQNELLERTGRLYRNPKVNLITAEGRHFLETTDKRYDLIFVQGVKTGTRFHPLSIALPEMFLFTPAAIRKMYEHLTDNGVLFLEDYLVLSKPRDPNSSAYRILAKALRQEGFEALATPGHALYVQNASRTLLDLSERPHEALIFSKKVLGDNFLKADELNISTMQDLGEGSGIYQPSDDRPFIPTSWLIHIMSSLALVAVVATIIIFFAGLKSQSLVSASSQTMLFSGIGYILMFMAVFGPVHLFLGLPPLAAPTVFFAFFISCLPGAWIADHFKSVSVRTTLIATSVLAVITYAVLEYASQNSGEIRFVWLRAGLLILILSPFTIVAEIPYVAILDRTFGARRGLAFAMGKVGVFLGVVMGQYVQLALGFRALVAIAFGCYLLSAFLFSGKSSAPLAAAAR